MVCIQGQHPSQLPPCMHVQHACVPLNAGRPAWHTTTAPSAFPCRDTPARMHRPTNKVNNKTNTSDGSSAPVLLPLLQGPYFDNLRWSQHTILARRQPLLSRFLNTLLYIISLQQNAQHN